jgi:hypothetical protein
MSMSYEQAQLHWQVALLFHIDQQELKLIYHEIVMYRIHLHVC